MLGLALLASAFAYVQPRALSITHGALTHPLESRANFSQSVSSCPGYTLSALNESRDGFTAKLSLAGDACNAFGTDISDLTIHVTYESQSRLHVEVVDTAHNQFTVPEDIVTPPGVSPSSAPHKETSDLQFNYNPSPFAFWITRRSSPDSTPIFDTRSSSLPQTPVPAVRPDDPSTALDGFELVFEDTYVQLTSSLPRGANVYGLGEVVASAGLRRDVGGNGTIQTNWARDAGNPVDQNEYGIHPFYVEHRLSTENSSAQAHGVFLNSAAGADILLLSPPSSDQSVIQYRLLGGVLDLYFFSGPSPVEVVEQYSEVVGTPAWIPLWAFGLHLCRWGYATVGETAEAVRKMREADIPLEVQWNDIDLYHAYRDFTSDPVSFPGEDVRTFINELHKNHQRYIPILDAAIPVPTNSSDVYDTYAKGSELGVFITNPDGSEYVGKVWPGYTVFPDWFARPEVDTWWTEAYKNWSRDGVEWDGIWLDMNEASSFCEGSCGTGADLSNTSTPFILPGQPGNIVVDYPECYNSTTFGPSGNVTVNGTYTCDVAATASPSSELATDVFGRCGLGSAAPDYASSNINVNDPPYAIHNGEGRLSVKTIATNATHAGGYKELDVHNLWGIMEEKSTYDMVKELRSGERPFVVSRSTYAGAGKFTSHWLGDNYSKWYSMRYSIQGVLQFQLFQIPMVGADTCGFAGNSNEELCNRWMQLAAFTPFFRNHNIKGAISQEPYVWDSVADASRKALKERYRLLPYWYSLFANASSRGTPPVRPLFFEFPDDPSLLSVDEQFLVGSALLVTPVLYPNQSTVTGYFPESSASVVWRDWYTHEPVSVGEGETQTLAAPLSHINVHLKSGTVLLLHKEPGYTTYETTQGPYELLISLDAQGNAHGQAYIDDFISEPPVKSRTVDFAATPGKLVIGGKGEWEVKQKVTKVTIVGVGEAPKEVKVGGKTVEFSWEEKVGRVTVDEVSVDLNQQGDVIWV